MDFQQSRTYANITNAFQQELNLSARYELYAERARQELYIEIGVVYEAFAVHEREHATIWWRYINGGVLPSTEQNLLSSINEEAELGNNIYREYSRIAQEEGFDDIAALFSGIANIELYHDLRLTTFLDNMERGELFCKPDQTLWICMRCGNIMSGNCAPEICPVCGFPQGYYRLYDSNVI